MAQNERKRPRIRAANNRNHARVIGEIEHVLIELDGGDEGVGALRELKRRETTPTRMCDTNLGP